MAGFKTKYRNGWFDYNDLTTQTTPIAYTTGTIPITNDGLGQYSQSNYKPVGVTKLWNTSTNQFDFSELKIGDRLELRIDVIVTTTTSNQDVNLKLTFDIGGFPYDLNIITESYKLAGTYNITHATLFYIGNEGTRDNPAELRFTSDDNASILVNGFYITLERG